MSENPLLVSVVEIITTVKWFIYSLNSQVYTFSVHSFYHCCVYSLSGLVVLDDKWLWWRVMERGDNEPSLLSMAADTHVPIDYWPASSFDDTWVLLRGRQDSSHFRSIVIQCFVCYQSRKTNRGLGNKAGVNEREHREISGVAQG